MKDTSRKKLDHVIRFSDPLVAEKQYLASAKYPFPIHLYREFAKNAITFFSKEIKLYFFLR